MNKTIVERKIERLASIAVTDSKIVFSQNLVQNEIVSYEAVWCAEERLGQS